MHDIPQSITVALSKQQEKVYLLHLERDLISFIKKSLIGNSLERKAGTYTIQAIYLKNSYYRLLSHQLCSYYQLQHWNNTSNEIMVSATEGVDYEKSISDMESKDNNGNGSLSNYCSRRSQEPKGQKEPSGTAGNDMNKEGTSTKPKMLIKKGKPTSNKRQIASPDQNTSDTTDGVSVSSPIRNEESTPISSADTSQTNISKIESERASKEALYMQIREKIFQDGQEDDQDEEDDEEEDAGPSYDNSVDSKTGSSNSMHDSNDQYTPNGFNMMQNSVYPYPQVPIPMPLPMGYNNVTQSFPPGPYFNPTSVPGHPPSMSPYMDYYLQGARMMHPSNNYYNYGPLYDKETERRLLNNPYIIIPDENSYEKKPRRSYKNNRHLSSDQKTNIPSNDPTQ